MRVAFYFQGQSQQKALPIVTARVLEAINRLPWLELILASPKQDLTPSDYLGKKAGLTAYLKLAGGVKETVAKWEGLLFEFGRVQASWASDKLFAYRVLIRPSLWKLSYTEQSRAFKLMTRPDAVKQALQDAGIKGFKMADPLTIPKAHPKLEQIVQYQENDLQFIVRMLGREGLNFFYLPVGLTFSFSSLTNPADYFRLTDARPTLDEQKSPLNIKFQPQTGMITSTLHVDSANWAGRASPQNMAVQAYFSSASYQPYPPSGGKRSVTGGTVGEVYRVEGTTARQQDNTSWTPQDYADKLTQIRAEELTYAQAGGDGASNDINVRPCLMVTFSPDPFQGGSAGGSVQYQITGVQHQWELGPQASGDAEYQNRFSMIKQDSPLRPQHLTPWPRGDV